MDQPPTPDFDPGGRRPWYQRRGLKIGGGLLILVALPLLWTTQPLLGVTRRGAATISPASLERDVRTLVERFPRRSDAHPEVLLEAGAWLEGELRAASARVQRQTYEVGGRSYMNLRAFYGPEGGARVVVGAHYDTCDELPGADDNASGVAGLLALARRLGAEAPTGPVELVAYTLEEPPTSGGPPWAVRSTWRPFGERGQRCGPCSASKCWGPSKMRRGRSTIPYLGWG